MRKTSQPTKHVFFLHLTLPPIIMVQWNHSSQEIGRRTNYCRWWIQILSLFHRESWGNDPIWRICFNYETTNSIGRGVITRGKLGKPEMLTSKWGGLCDQNQKPIMFRVYRRFYYPLVYILCTKTFEGFLVINPVQWDVTRVLKALLSATFHQLCSWLLTSCIALCFKRCWPSKTRWTHGNAIETIISVRLCKFSGLQLVLPFQKSTHFSTQTHPMHVLSRFHFWSNTNLVLWGWLENIWISA